MDSGSGGWIERCPAELHSGPHTSVYSSGVFFKKGQIFTSTTRNIQLRPDVYTPTDQDVLNPRKTLARAVEETRASLAHRAVVWDKQRTDRQLVMRSGLGYLDAFELVNGNHVVHPRIPVRELTFMLARMIFWRKRNQTPWAKYVPSWCYKKAESHLERLDTVPPRWPSLRKQRLDESTEVMEALYSEVGDMKMMKIVTSHLCRRSKLSLLVTGLLRPGRRSGDTNRYPLIQGHQLQCKSNSR